MTSIRPRLMTAILALTLGAGSLSAIAQDNSGSSGTAGTTANGAGQGHGNYDPAQHAEKMRQYMEKRAAELHDKLKLNASQEAAWNTYVARMRPTMTPQMQNREELNQLTTPERMERQLARMKEHETMMVERIAATKEFYAILTAEQKKTFDEEFKRGMKGHHGHHGQQGHHRQQGG
jgi:periplasmic protein CpxP/Spy